MARVHCQPGTEVPGPSKKDLEEAEQKPWQVDNVSLDRKGKETNIVLELEGPDPLSDAALRVLGLEYGKSNTFGKSCCRYSGRMVCLRGTEFEGVWSPLAIKRRPDGGSTMSCWANYDSTAGWKPLTWGMRPHEAGSNVCIYDKATARGPHEDEQRRDRDGEGEQRRLAEKCLQAVANKGSLRVAPKLVLHTRATVFWVDEIDTVGQCFKANVFYELRARGIFERCINAEQQEEFLHVYGQSATQHPATLSNAVDEKDGAEETWTTVSTSRTHKDGLLDFCWKRRTTAIFSERMELIDFPLDIQELKVMLSREPWVCPVPGSEMLWQDP
ncbi:hypothetical protein T484DRAFT_3637951 [Baffinella frigidus]|nr:hypothetical protein T484DRAFT_3637951 [Cryptophyta sp. CCMP2293]